MDSSGVRVNFGSDVEVGITDTLRESFDEGSVFRPTGEPGVASAAGDGDFAFDPGGETRNLGSWLEQNRKSTMILASTATGGDALFESNVGKAVDEVNKALGHHYLLAYVADHAGDGKAYSIKVRIPGHPDYRVDYRTGYVDQSAAVRSGQRMRSAMLFGADANPLGIRVDIGDSESRFRLGAAGSKRIKVPLHVKIPYGRLEMIERGDLYWSKVWISLFAEDAAGQPVRVGEPRAAHHRRGRSLPAGGGQGLFQLSHDGGDRGRRAEGLCRCPGGAQRKNEYHAAWSSDQLDSNS